MPELTEGVFYAVLIGLFIGGIVAFLLVAFLRIFLPECGAAAQRLDSVLWEMDISLPFRGFRLGCEGRTSSRCEAGDGGDGGDD